MADIKNDLTVSLVQYAPEWEDTAHNLRRLTEMLHPLKGKTDLIILPEMFATGFSMNVKHLTSGNKQGDVISWMEQQAEYTAAMITGSIAVKEGDAYYNRFYWIKSGCTTGYYDKHHLFSMSEEPKYFTAGTEQKTFNLCGWKIKPVICYDLRFPAWCRNTSGALCDLLICVASWPSVRNDVWLSLLKARALENQCYVAGVNRTGKDGNGLEHQGDSVVFGPKGEVICKIKENTEDTASFTLSLSTLHDFRKKFPVLNDMDHFYWS
jgi:predicted amidohydrolase